MQRLRTLHPGQNFTSVPNDAMDRLPDLESLGLLIHILRHSDEWTFRLDDLVERKSGVTRRTASKARATLIRYGYLVIVKYRHTHRGQFATEVWRSSIPFSDDDLIAIGHRYQHGGIAQITRLGLDKRPDLDNVGRARVREVTITWAQVEGRHGKQVVAPDGSLIAPAVSCEDSNPGPPDV